RPDELQTEELDLVARVDLFVVEIDRGSAAVEREHVVTRAARDVPRELFHHRREIADDDDAHLRSERTAALEQVSDGAFADPRRHVAQDPVEALAGEAAV